MLQIPASDLLQLAINGPFANRPLVSLLYYVDEACFLDHVLDEWCHYDVLPRFLTCFGCKVGKTMHYIARRDGAVFRFELWDWFAVLDVTARGDVAARRQGQSIGY